MKKVLVTGAAGFIGSKTAEFLLHDGVEVVGVDNMNDYYEVSLKNLRLKNLINHSKFKFEQVDIEDKNSLLKIFDQHQFDVVFN